MPTFAYEALDASGKPRKAEIDAASSDEAISKIKSMGFFPTSVRERKTKGAAKTEGAKAAKKKKKGDFTISFGKVKTKTLTQFTRQLSTLQDAGLSLLRSLQVLEQQQRPGLMKNIIGSVAEDVEGGSTLSDAMAKQPKAFDRLYVKMVAAGEIGGVLDLILQRLADFLEKAQRLKAKIRGAMIYPAAVISIAVLIVTGIMVFVIPKFQEIFIDFEIELPGLTVWLIDTSRWMAAADPGQAIPGAVWVVVSPFVAWLFIKLARKTEPGRAVVDRVAMHYPDVRHEHMYVDACAMAIALDPRRFDVILTENLFGDILSDEAGAVAGSLGLLPSASIGSGPGLYEPVHGSAPTLAGQDAANPIGAIASAAMLLRHSLAADEAALAVERAIGEALEAGLRTADLATTGQPAVSCSAMTEAIVSRLRR